jgi:hypothetical protein
MAYIFNLWCNFFSVIFSVRNLLVFVASYFTVITFCVVTVHTIDCIGLKCHEMTHFANKLHLF